MTVILADKQFIKYYNVNPNRQGVIATIPWASTGKCSRPERDSCAELDQGIAQLFLGGTLANWIGRLWTLRLSILFMILGV